MKLLLSCPFRTHFNLKSDQIIAHPEVMQELAKLSSENLPDSLSDILVWNQYSSVDNKDDLIFSSLNADTQLFATHFIKLVENDHFDEILAKVLKTIHEDWTVNEKENAIYLCDNSIGIAQLSITIDNKSLEDPTSVDLKTSELAKAFVTEIQRKYIEELCRRIYQIASKQSICLVQEPGKFETMHDLNRQKDFAKTSCLWASRILSVEKLSPAIKKFLMNWTVDAEEAIDEAEERNSTIFLGWGNSFLVGKADFEHNGSFAIHHMNYYYAVFDIVNKNMTYLFSVLSLQQNKKTLQKLIHNANYIASNIDLLIILFEDELQNLQGSDREYAQSLFYSWDVQVLSESIQNKSKLINDKIAYLNQAKMAKSQKSMDAMITFLGGLALVDLTLVLSAFSNSNENDDEFYGVVDLVRSSEPDILISLAFVVVVAFTIVHYFVTRKQN